MAGKGSVSQLTAAEFTPSEQAYIDTGGATAIDGAAQPEPDATPAPIPDPAASASPGETKPPSMVPHAAMHEERVRRQATEKELAEERKSRLLLEERTNLILQRFAAPAATEAPAALPDPEKDPAGFLTNLIQTLGNEVQGLKQTVSQNQQEKEQILAANRIGQQAQAAERDFMKVTPDYADAINHLLSSRHAELTALGYTDPNQRGMLIQQESQQIAAHALQQGLNPAEVAYTFARQRGYQPKVPDATQPPAAAVDATAQLTAIKKGQEANISLGSARGSAPSNLTAATLLAMSAKDFDAMMQTPEGRAIMGS